MKQDRFIPISEPSIGKEELKNVISAVSSGWVSSKGEFISEFEREFSDFVGTSYALTTSNGTTALHLALSAIGIEKDDRVIVPDLTFVSPVNAVIYNSGIPELTDVNRLYWNLDPEKLEERIDRQTKAIIVVHLYGHPTDMDPVLKIAKEHDLMVIEDCAEAIGAGYKGRNVGTLSDIACFSFYGNKIITTGEGGMCVTNDSELHEKMTVMRDHGMRPERKYWHEMIGYNYRMTNLQAAIGVAQMTRIIELVESRRKTAKLYKRELEGIDDLITHPEMSWAKSVFWLYSILINERNHNVSRDSLSAALLRRGIDNRRFFYPVHSMPPYEHLSSDHNFSVSNQLSRTGMNLPTSANLNKEDIVHICNEIKDIIETG